MADGRKRPIQRTLRFALLSVIMVLLLVLLSMTWLTQTRSGSRFVFDQAAPMLPRGIVLGSFSGVLAERFELTDVAVQHAGWQIAIERLTLHWDPLRLLFSDDLVVHELNAHGVTCVNQPADAATTQSRPAEQFELPPSMALPVNIELAALRVLRVRCRFGPDAEPIELERLEVLSGRMVDTVVTLEQFELASDWLQLKLRGSADLRQQYPIEVTAQWQLQAEGLAPFNASTRISGDLSSLRLSQDLGSPYNFTAQATVSDALRGLQHMHLQSSLTLASARLDQWRSAADGTDPFTMSAEATLDGTINALTLRQLSVRQPGHEGSISGSGQVSIAAPMSADLTLNWQALRWPLTGPPRFTSRSGALQLTGNIDAYEFFTSMQVQQPQLPPLQLDLNGRGDASSLHAELQGQADSARLSGQAQLRWQPQIHLALDLDAQQFDPAQIVPDWPGRLDVSVQAVAEVQQQSFDLTIENFTATGKLRQQPLELQTRGVYTTEQDQHRARIEELQLAYGDSSVRVDGQFNTTGADNDLRWKLNSPNLTVLLPALAGSIDAAGTLSGSWPELRLTTQLTAQRLAYYTDSIQDLALQADVDLAGDVSSTVDLQASRGVVGNAAIDQLVLHGSGRPDDHRLTLQIESTLVDARLSASGQVTNPWHSDAAWRVTLQEGRISHGALAPWYLDQPSSAAFTADVIALQQQCWSAAPSGLCFALSAPGADGNELQATATLHRFAFDYLQPLLPQGYQLTGDLTGAAQLQLIDGGAFGNLQLTSSGGALRITPPSNHNASDSASDPDPDPGPADQESLEPLELVMAPSFVTARLDQSGTTGELSLQLDRGHINAQLSTPPVVRSASGRMNLDQLPLQIRAGIDIPDLGFVARLLPQVNATQGVVSGELRVGGTTADPEVTGSLTLADGMLHLPNQGLRYSDVGIAVTGSGLQGIELSARATSNGTGTLLMQGTMDLLDGRPTGDLAVTGTAFQLLNTHEASIRVSPELRLRSDERKISVDGTIRIPFARITPDPQPPAAVHASPDQVLLRPAGEEPVATQLQRELFADVRLLLGEQVNFDGFGLQARLEGDVLAKHRPDTPVTATGELRIIDGEYRAYGQGLVIESGRIYFAGGPVDRPALDIRAIRRPAEGITVGAHVQGTLEQPEFELFSEPGMSQHEQLSYLVLGRSAGETSGGESSALSQAALALGVKGGDALAKRIGSSIGVDEIAVRSGSGEAGSASDPNQAALVIGKYLSPKLYISYGIGIFEPSSILRLQYEISRRWKLLTESGDSSTAAELVYTIETGHN